MPRYEPAGAESISSPPPPPNPEPDRTTNSAHAPRYPAASKKATHARKEPPSWDSCWSEVRMSWTVQNSLIGTQVMLLVTGSVPKR